MISAGSRRAKWMYWIAFLNASDEKSWKSFKTFWFLFLLSKIRAYNLGSVFFPKTKYHFSLFRKAGIILVSSCVHSYHFMSNVNPRNTSAEERKICHINERKRSKPTFLLKAMYSASIMQVVVRFFYTIISFSTILLQCKHFNDSCPMRPGSWYFFRYTD